MISFLDVFSRVKFWKEADRLGPDFPLTQLALFFPKSMTKLCLKKFKIFGTNAEFRPGAHAAACSKISIGRNVVIRPGTFLYADPRENGGSIIIEDDVLIGPAVHFYTNNHEFSKRDVPIISQGYPEASNSDTIIVRRNSWIGAACVILPGVEIGMGSVIGAGTVVTRSVPPGVMFAGNPGKVLRKI